MWLARAYRSCSRRFVSEGIWQASLLAAIVGCMLARPALAQPKSTAQAIAEQRIEIRRSADGAYSGPGWERLLADARTAQFVMIGEQHATADIARFGLAMHRALAPLGYTHAALEIGPHSTDHVEELIRSGTGKLAGFIQRPGNAFTVPFLFFAEEIALVEQIVARSPDKKDALWGLDQEFLGAGRLLLVLLERRARSEAQRAAVRAFDARNAADPFLIGTMSSDDLAPLAAAFRRDPQARAIIDAIRISNEIYGPFTRDTGPAYPANLTRENYMKTNFVRSFTEVERRLGRPPKVFMKLGGNHAMRGFSTSNVPGFGNFLAEWGHARGFTLLNMLVVCHSGEALDPQTSTPAPCEPPFASDSPLAKLGKDADVTLIDLRPLRARLSTLKDLDPETRETILAFDYYLALSNVKAATPVAAFPKP